MLLAGTAKFRITPAVGARLTGFAARKSPSLGVHDELHVRALALDRGDAAVILLSADVLALTADFAGRARRAIATATGVPAGAVMAAATHTHAGPVTITTFFNPGERPDPGYLDRLLQGMVSAATQAWKARSPARLGVGARQVRGVCTNRRAPGKGPVDEEIGLVRIDDGDGKPRAVVLLKACHPTVLGPDNLLISGDFPAAALDRIERGLGPGSFALFLNGAEGDISIGRSSELSAIGILAGERTFERAGRIGGKLARATLEALPGIETTASPMLDWAGSSLRLPLKSYPAVEEAARGVEQAQARLRHLESGGDSDQLRQARIQLLYSSIHHAFARQAQEVPDGRLPVELQAFRLHQALLLGVPAEPFAEIGLRLKRGASHFRWIVGLANGYLGYLPTRAAHAAGGYEVVASPCAPEAEDALLEAALELDGRLFAAPPQAGPGPVEARP